MTMDEASSVSEAYIEHATITAIFENELPVRCDKEGSEDGDPATSADDVTTDDPTLANGIEGAVNDAIVDLLDEVVFGANSSQTVTEHEAIEAVIREVAGVAASSLIGALTDRQTRLATGIADAPSCSVDVAA